MKDSPPSYSKKSKKLLKVTLENINWDNDEVIFENQEDITTSPPKQIEQEKIENQMENKKETFRQVIK